MISIIASLFGVILTTTLTHEQLLAWGWRIPYVFGLLVGPAGLYIRSRIPETPQYLAARSSAAPLKSSTLPLRDLLSRQPIALLLALGAAVISNSSYYLLLYIPTYAVKTLHLPASTGFTATLVGGIILAVFSLVAGHWSDKSPRPRIMLITGWLFLLTSYPVFWLMVAYPSLASAIFAVGWLNLVKAGYSGVLPSLMAEQFPVETRAIGVALSFGISVTIFGGFAPLAATWLIALTNDPLSPSYYLMVTALLSIVALMFISRRKPVS
jgi:MHS family proline/betaine transporter-like MFS transporter